MIKLASRTMHPLLSCNSHLAGPHDLFDPDRSEKLDDRGDLLFITRHLKRIALLRRVDHARPEDVGDPESLGPMLGRSIDLDQAHLALYEFLVREIGHFDDVDEFVQLFDDLFQDALVPRCHDRHLRDRRVERRSDGNRFDIEPSSAEEP